MSDPILKIWYCPNCRLQKKLQKPRRASKTENTSQQNSEVMKLDSICVCGTKPSVSDKLLKCHSLDGQNGKYFHLNCLDYKRMPNNSQTTCLCSSCKEKDGSTKGKNAKSIPHVSTNIDSHLFGSCLVNDASDRFHTSNNPNENMSKAALKNGSVAINPTTCSSTTSFSNNVPLLPLPPGNINNNLTHPTGTMKGTDSSRANANAGCSVPHSPTGSNDNIGNCASDDDIEITKLAEGETNKHASLGNLSDNHFDTILSPTG